MHAADGAKLRAAREAWQRGDLATAEAQCRQALAATDDPAAWTLLGVILRQRDRFEAQHRRHIQLVAGRHDHEIGKRPQIDRVEDAVVRRAVRPRQTGTVEAERHRQVLQRYLLEELVVGPL